MREDHPLVGHEVECVNGQIKKITAALGLQAGTVLRLDDGQLVLYNNIKLLPEKKSD